MSQGVPLDQFQKLYFNLQLGQHFDRSLSRSLSLSAFRKRLPCLSMRFYLVTRSNRSRFSPTCTSLSAVDEARPESQSVQSLDSIVWIANESPEDR